MNSSIEQLMISLNDINENQLFCERAQPILTHLQLCEGLNSVVVSEVQSNSLHVFEKLKLKELLDFNKETGIYPANLKNLRLKLVSFAEQLIKQNEGVVPFVLSINRDYAPQMTHLQLLKFDKITEYIEKEQNQGLQSRSFNTLLENKINRLAKIVSD